MVRHLLEGNGTVPLDQFRAGGGLYHAAPRVMKRKYFYQTATQILKGVFHFLSVHQWWCEVCRPGQFWSHGGTQICGSCQLLLISDYLVDVFLMPRQHSDHRCLSVCVQTMIMCMVIWWWSVADLSFYPTNELQETQVQRYRISERVWTDTQGLRCKNRTRNVDKLRACKVMKRLPKHKSPVVNMNLTSFCSYVPETPVSIYLSIYLSIWKTYVKPSVFVLSNFAFRV